MPKRRRAPQRRRVRAATAGDLSKLLPARRTQVYDVRKIVAAFADRDSVFELKPQFGKVAVTALARLDGRTVGIVANNPMFKGGALDTDACDKITSFLVLCDSFNIPARYSGRYARLHHRHRSRARRAPGKIMNFMNALSLCTVPKLSVILRKSYGQAYLNMGGGRNSDEVAAWPTAEISFMDPNFAVRIVHGHAPDSPEFKSALQEMERDNSVYGIADIFSVQDVIRPDETRDHLIRHARCASASSHQRRRRASDARLADELLNLCNASFDEGQDRMAKLKRSRKSADRSGRSRSSGRAEVSPKAIF